MTDKGKDAPDHEKLLRQFEEAFDTTQTARSLAERDRDYYDGKQYTSDEEAVLRQRGQPIVVSNRIAPKIDALLGHAERMQADPKAYPRTPQHEQDADSITDAIRFVCDQNKFPELLTDAADNLFVEGVCAATVTVEQKPDGQFDVKLYCVPWDRFYYDPHSRKRDFSDASYKGVVVWMDEADALAQFKDKEDVIGDAYVDTSVEGETYDDKPKFLWADNKRKRVRVLQHRWREKGKWMTAIVCKGGYLRDPQVSPFVDEHGIPVCDLIAASAYVDRENNRYGVARRHISPQDEINKRRSKALHLLNSKKIVAQHGAVDDVERARSEAARPDGYIEVAEGMRFDFVDEPGLVAGQFQLLQEAKQEIDASGVNPSLEGDAQAPSGRAQEMLTQAGLSEMVKPLKALRGWSWEVYRQVWLRIRQYWTDERWIRVTDDERNLRWVGLNQQGGQPLSELEVDIILQDAPDSITIQSEEFEKLVEMKKADPASIPTRAIIEASSLRNKDQIIEHIEQGGIPPQVQQQMQEMQQALQECQKQLADAQTDAQGKEADRQIKAMELRIKEYEAVTARITALKPEPIADIPDGWQGDASTPNVPDA
jgi:hypothetical protein